MTRILVVPEQLHQLSVKLQGVAGSLRSLQGSVAAARSGLDLDLEVRAEAGVDGQAAEAVSRAGSLAADAEAMAMFLAARARLFGDADRAGEKALQRDTGLLLAALAAMLPPPAAAGLGAVLGVWSRIGTLLRPGPALPAHTEIPWFAESRQRALRDRLLAAKHDWWQARLRGDEAAIQEAHERGNRLRSLGAVVSDEETRRINELYAPQARPAQAPGQPAKVPDQPAPAPDQPAPAPDPFWAAAGEAPVVSDGTGLRFSPGFQEWADRFNDQIRGHWAEKSADGAGTTGPDALTHRYLLTPQKVGRLWEAARAEHVDPRLLLAILRQEGNGSFNTNAANAVLYTGHGPQPDWEQDLEAALQGTIVSKLRLYGHAARAGFEGTWLQWVNWYTPMDTPRFQGLPGAYATDIHWSAGVERAYLEIARSTGDGSGDPVAAYAGWMEHNADLFRPRHIEGEFTIKPGLAPGAQRPVLHAWHQLAKPHPEAELNGSWWKFPADDRFCWYLDRTGK